MQIGQIFRYSRPYSAQESVIDGFPNYFHSTAVEGLTLPLLDKGISPIASVTGCDGVSRVPAILISSSPHKAGSSQTPWQDYFDPDYGHIHYFGDNKHPGQDPNRSPGNRSLLHAFNAHSSPDAMVRLSSTPIVFFRRVSRNAHIKGYVQFQGFGVIKNVELVTQIDRQSNSYFSNYVFDFLVMSLAKESEEFNWEWINCRRNSQLDLVDTHRFAPESWRVYLDNGSRSIERVRRRVSRLLVSNAREQMPGVGTPAARVLKQIYDFYALRKARFEALAAEVVRRILDKGEGAYRLGWITPSVSDGGSDFVGRFDVGSGFSVVKIIVLGQAKCENLRRPTSGRDIARTVARLRRGWIGVYVTTSYFSEAVQREIIEDKYPLLLIHGLRLAEEVSALMHEQGFADTFTFLQYVDAKYDELIRIRHPEEILSDP